MFKPQLGHWRLQNHFSCTKHKSTFMNAFNQRQQEHEEPGAASSSSHVLNSLWFPEFTSASSKFLCAPLHQHRKREAVCMVSNNKDEKIHANPQRKRKCFFNEKESAAYGTKLIISLTYLEIPVPTFTKDLF